MAVVIGALGTIKKGLDQTLQLLLGHLLAIELQQITLMSTAEIVCKVMGVYHSDLLLRSGITRKPPPNN